MSAPPGAVSLTTFFGFFSVLCDFVGDADGFFLGDEGAIVSRTRMFTGGGDDERQEVTREDDEVEVSFGPSRDFNQLTTYLNPSSRLAPILRVVHDMAVASSSRAAKRARLDSEDHRSGHEEHNDEASASHLVSFLTGYDNRHDSDHDHDSDDQHDEASEDEFEDDVDEDGDPDEEATPTKRAKTGLIGTSTPRSARSTPGKRKTPRKAATPLKLPQEGDPGFVRPTRSDAYFFSTSRASRTSGNSYSALVKPLSEAQYERYASGARSKGKSKEVVQDLLEDATRRYDQWEAELDEGFNLMMYGFGSKRRALNAFVKERLARRGHCVVINGHFPGTSIREVLGQIEDTLAIPQDTPVPPSAIIPLERSAFRTYAHFLPADAISKAKQREWPVAMAPLFLVIHNIDASALRSPRSLAILSLLASSPNIHLVASFDHLHTPLLFSATVNNTPPHEYSPSSWNGTPPSSRGFNWIYHNLTTYDDYDLELTYQRLASSSSALITSSSAAGISEEAALQILKSVPPMALRLIKLLLSRQLAALPPDAATHTAHPLAPVAPVFATDNDTLQRLSREKFIAREEERFNALMGEFKDHGLVVEAQTDGEGRTGRWVWIPLGKAAVERVLETMEDVEV
jgi:origin recognition complex subunit 2